MLKSIAHNVCLFLKELTANSLKFRNAQNLNLCSIIRT